MTFQPFNVKHISNIINPIFTSTTDIEEAGLERSLVFLFFWASSLIHCLVDLGANVEQPFDCLIVQNRQAMQSMGRSMDWTLEDNMVDGSFFCAALAGRRGGHTPFVQAGAETFDTGVEVVEPDPGFWEGHSGVVGIGAVAVLRETWVGHGTPDFWLTPSFVFNFTFKFLWSTYTADNFQQAKI